MKKIEKTNCGIYCISTNDGKPLYIGSSGNIEKIFLSHYGNLINKNHSNEKLKKAAFFYGFENLTFRVIYYCNDVDLFYYENLFINTLNPICNTNSVFRFKEKTNKTKEISIINIDNDYKKIYDYFENNTLDDVVVSKELAEKISSNFNEKISYLKVAEVIKKLGYTKKQLHCGKRIFVKSN